MFKKWCQVAVNILKAVARQSGTTIPEQEPSYPKTKNNYKSSTESPAIGKVLVPDPNYKKDSTQAISTDAPKSGSSVTVKAGAVTEAVDAANADSEGSFVLPEASFVMKTRRSDGIKYFINVTDHSDVPPGRIATSSVIAKESIEKDGSMCHVFDVCLNRDYLTGIIGNQSEEGDGVREQVRQ